MEIDDARYKIWDVDVLEDDVDVSKAKKFGEHIYILDDCMYAKCADGYVRINEIQKNGKNRLKAKDFINGLKF